MSGMPAEVQSAPVNVQEAYQFAAANPDVMTKRLRPSDPPQIVARRLELKDPRAGNYSLHRDYVTPSYTTAKPGEAEALDLLMKIAASGSTSRLYKKLVVESKVASSAGGDYSGSGLDSGTISIYAIAADGVPLEKVEALADDVFNGIANSGGGRVDAPEFIPRRLCLQSDNQRRWRRYTNLAVGRTVADVEKLADAISKVTLDDIKVAAEISTCAIR
jgi:zinc protease